MERCEETTPLFGIYGNMDLPSTTGGDGGDSDGERTKVILISTGSFNPVHRMHIRLFFHAKRQLERDHNCHVIGAFLSPSHDRYVLTKQIGTGFCIAGEDRAELIRVSIADSGFGEWLFVDQWEMLQPSFVPFTSVVRNLREYIAKSLSAEDTLNLRVMYICGSDLFMGCLGLRALRSEGLGVCVVTRPGYPLTDGYALGPHVFPVEPLLGEGEEGTEEADLSSTKVRELYQAGESYGELMYPSAAKMMETVNTSFSKKDLTTD